MSPIKKWFQVLLSRPNFPFWGGLGWMSVDAVMKVCGGKVFLAKALVGLGLTLVGVALNHMAYRRATR